MLTIAFVILKFTDSLLLSWWWLILAIIIDLVVRDEVSKRTQNAYFVGYEEGKEDKGESEDALL